MTDILLHLRDDGNSLECLNEFHSNSETFIDQSLIN